MNLEGAKKFLEDKGFNVYYIALYGSQNYGLDIETSDFDYKAIILPTLNDLVNNSKPFSSIYEFEGGQIDVKDIRAYQDSTVKCNINFIEILNSQYYIGSKLLRKFFIPLQKEMGQLFIKACYGMMLEKYEALRHPYPSTVDKIEKFGYDPKQLHHIVRLRILIQRYISGNIGDYFHTGSERDELIGIKKGNISNEEATVMAEHNLFLAKQMRDNYTTQMIFEAKESFLKEGKWIIKENIIEDIINNYHSGY